MGGRGKNLSRISFIAVSIFALTIESSPALAEIVEGVNFSPVDSIPAIEKIPKYTHRTLAGMLHHGMQLLEVWHGRVAPGGASPIHKHPSDEIIYIISGTAEMRLEDRNLTALPDSFFTIPSNITHQVINASDEELVLVATLSEPPIVVYAFESWDQALDSTKEPAVLPLPWETPLPYA